MSVTKSEVPIEQTKELIALPVVNSLDLRFATGPIMGRWFSGLKEQKFIATRCPSCGRTQTPPREGCALCVCRSEEVVEVGPKATVINFDTVFYASPDPLTGKVRSTPYSTLYMRMDGSTANDCFTFEGKAEDIPRLRPGIRVKPVWNEIRTGSIHDLLYFEIDD